MPRGRCGARGFFPCALHYIGVGILLLAMNVGQNAAADTPSAFTLADCYQAALRQSEVLAEQQELITQAEERYQQAFGAVLPNLGAEASLLGQGESGLHGHDPDLDVKSSQHYARLSLSQPLFRGFRELAAIHQAGDLISAQREARAWASLQLFSDVSQAYFTVLSYEQDLVHIDAQLGLYAQRIRDLQARVAIGRSRTSEVLSFQAAQAILKAQAQEVRGQLGTVREVLSFLTGVPPDLVLSAPGAPPQARPLEDYLAACERRPDILAAVRQVEAARRGVAIASGEHWPSLDLNGNFYVDRPAPLESLDWDAELMLTLPLFSGGTIVARTREAESQVRAAEQVLGRLRRLAAQTIRARYAVLTSNQARLVALEEAAEISEKNYRAVLRDYNLGLETNLDVIQSLVSSQDTLRTLDQVRFQIGDNIEQLEILTAQRHPPQKDLQP
jgi:outer membrane protein TolC